MPQPVTALRHLATSAETVGRSGMLGPYWPWQLTRVPGVLWRRGLTLGSLYGFAAAVRGEGVAVIDDAGSSTFSEMETLTDALALGMADHGISSGDTVAVLCRNHRRFIATVVALGKLGSDVVYLNTGFAGPQLGDVVEREGVSAIVADQELMALTDGVDAKVRVHVVPPSPSARPGPSPPPARSHGDASFDELVAAGWGRGRPAIQRRQGRQVLLTSGTSGTPKGAQRRIASPFGPLKPLLSILNGIPLRSSDTMLIAAPMFHSWGLANTVVALVLGARIVLPRRFDAEETLRLIATHRVSALIAVPMMIQRIMALPQATLRRYDTTALRVVGLSGSALPGDLAVRFMDVFGDVVYNLYGSTEVGWASIAGPRDLREAPGTAGRVPLGTTVRILDPDGAELAVGETGHIFVRSGLLFDNYTGGGRKAVIDGFMASGDMGVFDRKGRLFVAGRDDDMIVSGGENIFPREVEDLLADHPSVSEAAVVGVDDREFGQRLVAFVVAGRHPLDGEALKAHVRSRLARHKVPRQIVVVAALPRNATGKVLTRELPGLLATAPQTSPSG